MISLWSLIALLVSLKKTSEGSCMIFKATPHVVKEDSQPDLAFFNPLVETAIQRHILPKRKEQERESQIASKGYLV